MTGEELRKRLAAANAPKPVEAPATTPAVAPEPGPVAPQTSVQTTATPTAKTPVVKRQPKASVETTQATYKQAEGSEWPVPGTPQYAKADAETKARVDREWAKLTPQQQEQTRKFVYKNTDTPVAGPERAPLLTDPSKKPPETVTELFGLDKVGEVGTLLAPALARAVPATPLVDALVKQPIVQKADAGLLDLTAKKQQEARERAAYDEQRRQDLQANPSQRAALELADTLRNAPAKSAARTFLERRSLQLIRERGAENIKDGAAFQKLKDEAAQQALSELVNLSTSRQVPWDVDPRAIDPTADLPSWENWKAAFGPKLELRADGKTAKAEGGAEWLMNVPISLLDYTLTSAFQGLESDNTTPDFVDRFRNNLGERRDVVTAMIEGDPDLQADLSSGDGQRVTNALKKLGPFVGLLILTPDPASVLWAGYKGSKAALSVGRNAKEIAKELKAAGTAAEKVSVLTSAVETAKKADEAKRVALKNANLIDQVAKVQEAYTQSGDVTQATKGVDKALAEEINDSFAAALRADPEVAAYLSEIGKPTGNVDLKSLPSVKFGPDEEARLTEIEAKLKELGKQAEAAPDRVALEPIQSKQDLLRRERATLKALQVAKAGETKFAEHYKRAADLVLEDVRTLSEGGTTPARRASDVGVTPAPVVEAPEAADVLGAFGGKETFTTAKGSTYTINPDGTTTRVKAPRPEHPGDSGPKPASQQTVYVTPEDAEKLGIFQTKGGSYTGKHIRTSGSEAAVFGAGIDGRVVGLGTSRVPVQTKPAVGLIPVELWKDGREAHFGNVITSVGVSTVDAKTAERIANADTPEKILDALRRAPPEVQEHVAGRLGYKSFEDIRARVLGGPQSKTLDKLHAQEQAAHDAVKAAEQTRDALPPEVQDLYRQAEEAMKNAPQVKVRQRGRPKTAAPKVPDTVTDAEAKLEKVRAYLAAQEAKGVNPAVLEKLRAGVRQQEQAVESLRAAQPVEVPKPAPEPTKTRVDTRKADELYAQARAAEEAHKAKSDVVVQSAKDSLSKIRKKVLDTTAKAVLKDAEKASLMAALEGARPEFRVPADQLRATEDAAAQARRVARAPVPEDVVIALARDRSDLEAVLDLRTRIGRRAARGPMRRVLDNTVTFFRDHLGKSWRDVQEASLTEAASAVQRMFEGEAEGVGSRLTRAFVGADPTSPTPNLEAFRAITPEEVAYFKRTLQNRNAPAEFLTLVTGAYLKPDVPLDAPYAKALLQTVADWAATDEDLVALSERVLDTTRQVLGPDKLDQMRPRQVGDVMLAYGSGLAGAAQRVQVEGGFVFANPEQMRDINSIFKEPTFGVGGNPRASRGIQLLSRGVTDPYDYTRPIPEFGIGNRPEVTQPYVPAFNATRVPKPKTGDFEDIAEEIQDIYHSEIYVPRAVRDAFQKYADAAIATNRLSNKMAGTDAALDFWKQAAILGVGLSNPGQSWMDHFGDIMQLATKSPSMAGKAAVRSTAQQFLNTQGVAQMARLADWLRNKSPGSTARQMDEVLSWATFSPDVQKALDGTGVLSNGVRGADELRAMREGGVLENFVSGQFTRTALGTLPEQPPGALSKTAGAVTGSGVGLAVGGPTGALFGAIAGALYGDTDVARKLADQNKDALMTMVNVISNRRRAAIYIGFREAGLPPSRAARETVKIVGDFSHELSPWMREHIAKWYPFFAYRKFNTRRTLQALANPYWMKAMYNAEGQAAQVANAYLDSSDEYGFHTTFMEDEPDPIELDGLYKRLRASMPGATEAQVYAEVDKQSDRLPRASERYNRLKAKLDGMDYNAAKQYIARAEDPDVSALVGPYWAPDPVRAGLPEYAQDRYAILLNKARSQALQSYYHQGEGRSERSGDEQRFILAPPDPNMDGLNTAILTALLPYTIVSGQGTAGTDLLSISSRDPFLSSLVQAAGFVNPDSNQDTPIPASIGQNLLVLNNYAPGTILVKNRNNEGIAPGDPSVNPGEELYYISGRANAMMMLAAPVTRGTIATLEAGKTAENFAGGANVKGDPDAVDNLGAWSWFTMGNTSKVRTGSAAANATFANMDATDRIEAANERMGQQQEPFTDIATRRMRETSLAAENPQDVERAVQTLRTQKKYDPRDIWLLRASLLRTMTPEEVGAMTDYQVVMKVVE